MSATDMDFWAWINWERGQIEISDGCSPLHGRVQAAAYFSPLIFSSSSPSWVMGSVYGLAVEQLEHLEKHGYPELSRLGVASYSHLIPTLNHFHILGTDMCHCTGSCATHCLGTKEARILLEPGTALTPSTDRQLTHRNPRQHRSISACSGPFVSLATLPSLLRAHHPLQTTNC